MNSRNFLTLAVLAGASSLGGCAVTARYVTATYTSYNDTDANVYIASMDRTKGFFTDTAQSHITLCNVPADNMPRCRPQPAVDEVLNTPPPDPPR